MVGSVFGFGPRGILAEEPAKPENRRASIEKLASDTQIPANILMAFEERGEPAEAAAQKLAAEIKAGKRVEDVVPRETLDRAYDIADELYPAPKAAEPEQPKSGALADAAKQFGGAIVRSVGSMGEAVGAAADIYADGGVKLEPETSMLGDAARAAGGKVKKIGEDITATVSDEGKAAMEGSMPDGDLLDPSTWTMGENPSLRGYTMLAADVMGSFLPVMATAIITKSPGASAMVGGAQGGGAAVETARSTVLEMARTPHPDGGTVLSHESAYYRELIDRGIPPDEALRRTSAAAEKMAMLFTVPVSAFGGAATGKILGPGVDALGKRGLAVRSIGTGALSSLEEGAQEAAETVATRTGINTGAQTDLSPTEGTFGDFILGALGGGVPGAAAGALQEKTGSDGSATGSAAVPGDGLSPPVGAGTGAAAPTTPLAPTGPISAIAGLAPDLTPQPEPEPPAPKFPDFKPGKEVRLADPETGVIHDAVFLNETPDGVMVRIAGGEFEIGREEFDASRLAAAGADEKAAGKKPKATKAKVTTPKPPAEPEAPAEGPFDAAAAALKEQGFNDGPWNDQNMPKPGMLDAPKLSDAAKPAPAPKRPKESLDDLSPEEALKRAKMLEDRAAEGGWTRPMKEKHQKLKAIAGVTDGKEAAAGGPDTGKRAGDAGKPAGNQPGRGARDAGLAAPGDGGAAAAPGQRVPVDPVRADGAADDDGALNRATDLSKGISDIGKGIGEGYVDMLFDRFTKGDTKDASGSESPALRIAKRIKEAGGPVTRQNMRDIAEEADRIMALAPEKRIEAARAAVVKFGGKPLESAPITTAPDKRVQPDMLGGQATTEADMAAREKRRKEWGRFLGIAENGNSQDDSTLDGREVLIRGKTVRIRAEAGKSSDADIKIDTAGMDRDQIAAAVRGAMNELDRRAPLPTSSRAEASDAGAPAAPVRGSEAAGEGPDIEAIQKRLPKGYTVTITKGGEKGQGRVSLASEKDGEIYSVTVDRLKPDDIVSIAEADAKPAKAPATPAKPAGILSVLSADKQARADELKKRLADKMRNQVSSGLDPEYITLGGELVKLYIEAGAKRFGQMLADFAETTGLTLKQAQEPLRAAYNHVRDNMELEGEDVSGMDDARAVLEEARKAIQGEQGKPTEGAEPVAEKAPQPAGTGREPPRPEKIPALIRWGVTGPETTGGGKFRDDVAYGFIKAHMADGGARTGGMTVPYDWGDGVIDRITYSFDQYWGRNRVKAEGRVFVTGPRANDAVWFNVDDIDAIIAAERKAEAKPVPTAAEVKTAASETDPNPTPAQAEAENYKTGKVNWRGLTLSIENAKGSIRRKVTPDGKTEWQVTMPAHYGRILGTTGADGDHIDFYMGGSPESERVFVVDQKDADTGKFDEIKVILGAKTPKEALNIYFKGFSDGRGKDRAEAISETNIDGIKQFLQSRDATGSFAGTKGAAWTVPTPTLQGVAERIGSVPEPEQPALPQLRGTRDNGASQADELPAVSGRGGRATDAPAPVGSRGQRSGVSAGQPPLADEKGTGAQYAQEPSADSARRNEDADRVGGSDESGTVNDPLQAGSRDERGARGADAGTDQRPVLKSTSPAALRKFPDFKGKLNGPFYDDRSEDGRFNAEKNAFHEAGLSFFRAAAKILKENGWTEAVPRAGRGGKPKPINPVSSNRAGPAVLGEVSITLMGPDGANGIYAQLGEAFSGGNRAQMLWRINQATNPYGSGQNQFLDPTGMTPQEFAEKVIEAHGRWAKKTPEQVKAATAPTPENINAAQAREAASVSVAQPEIEQDTPSEPAEPTPRVIEGAVEIDAADTDETVEVTVSREGPWDFNDTFPAPDPVQVGRLEVEGRSPFDANTPEEVVSILEETMAEAVDSARGILHWQEEAERIEAGQKPRFQVPKGADPVEEAVKNSLRAKEALSDTAASVEDVWGDVAAKAFRETAIERARISFKQSPPSETKAPPVPAPSQGLVSPDSSEPEKSATIGATATGKPRNEQRRNQRRDQGQPDLFAGTGGAVDGAGRSQAQRDGDGRGEGNEDPAGSQPGSEPAGSLVGDQGRLPDRAGVAPPNFTITDDFALGVGTDGQKLEANLAALRLVQKLEAENRYATAEEQAVLARWVGWGGLKTVFDEKHKGSTNQWGRAQAELRTLLTTSEYYDAMRSTNDAHYTSRTVVEAMWGAMRNFGFTGGRALEPTIGSGNFLGLQPADLSAQTDWFASELDPVTGRIAKHLYPRATVFDGMGFQDAPFRPATFDIAIGNPPFGGDNSRVGNKQMHPDLGRMKVHNFVIAKTGQLLREGGIMGMVVTHRFLDAMDAEARDVLAPNFHFLGAVRLPNTAFKANAGTEVTTDIVFFQKRRAGDEQGDTSWMGTGATGPNGTKLNAWFANNPDMILGRPAMDGTMYAGGRRGEGEFTVHDDGRDLGAALTEAMTKIKASLPDRVQQLEDAVTAPKTVSTLAYGEMVLTADGKIWRGDIGPNGPVIEEITRETFWKANAAAQFDLVQALRPFAEANLRDATVEQTQKVRDAALAAGLLDMAGDPVSQSTKFEQALADAIPALLFGNPTQAHRDAFAEYAKKVEGKRLGADGFDRLKAILDLRGRTNALIRAERNDDPSIEQIRGGLRTAYTEFRTKYGFLNSPKNEAILQGNVSSEMALEVHYKPAKDGREESATEAPILTKRVIYPYKLPERMDSVSDAVHVSMQEKGYIDPGLIMQLTGKEVSEVIAELTGGEKPLAFKNPATNRFELAESYLSGNLAEKIEKATAARAYEHIPHLKAAMPPPKTQNQITPSIRSMWIPREVFEDFLRAMGYSSPAVMIAEKVGMVSVQTGSRTANDFGDQFRGGGMSPETIFEHALKGKIPVVYDEIRTSEGTKRVKNEEATKDAVAAYERISAEFPNWAYANPMRAQTIIDAFNEKVNVVTPRKYEGTRYLRTVGTSPLVELRNSQKNGAWRMIQDKMVLLHHVVGAGKTMTGITGVMERKRMGLTRKAVVVVPNHLTGQWGKEWLELYPAANILVPTERDFEPANRSKLINRIATGDFDAVIIGHSQLVKIDNDPEIVATYIAEQMDALNDAMQEAKRSGDSRRTVGQMANRIAKLREKLERLNDELEKRRGSGLLAWHELGVDMLVLDESQEFKNLEYATTATQLVGMNDPGGSQKAFDLLMKLRSLQAMPNSNMTFMTGTPISNSLVEIYSVMKYLIPESLRAMGIEHFDAWKAAFIQDQSRFEYTASMQLKERNVMSGMVNLGPLAELYRSFADIVMRPDVERMYREQMEARNAANPDKPPVSTRFPTPKIKGGKRRIMLAPPTQNMEEFTRYLVMRMGGIQNAPDKKAYAKVDNPLWVLTDARKASVDIRTIDPTLGREEGSKVSRAGAEVYRIWEANKDRKGAQMVFCDMSTPSKTATKAAAAILKDAYGKIGLKKDALKRRIASDEGKSFAARWADVLGEVESLISSPDTPDATRDALNLWMATPDVQDAPAAMFTADTGFSFYDDLRALLIEKGIPEKEIAFIHDYDTTAKKKDLFEAVNEGKVRVLLGSTMKMGAGTNAQRRLVALHHIDAPWRPSDMEQREGRIIRQGNLFYEQDPDGFEVEIIAYSTEKTADVVQWQVLERKAKAIETFLSAASDSLVEEGGDADQYAEFMAQSTGKKVFLDKMQAEKDLLMARGRIASALRSKSEAESFLASFDEKASEFRAEYEALDKVTIDAFPDGAGDYLADWRGKIEAYRVARDKAEAEAEEVRKFNVGKERKDWKKLPEQPNAPKRWTERPTNAYEAAVYDALIRAQGDAGSEITKKIQLGNGFHIGVWSQSPQTGVWVYYAELRGPDGRLALLTDWGGVQSKDFRNSDKLLSAFEPAGIVAMTKEMAGSGRRRLQRHVDMKPRMQEIAAKTVDTAEVKALETRVAALTAETRIEEVKYAEQTAKAGENRFALLDDKNRNLVVDAVKPLTGQFQFQNAGRQYAATWGAPAGRKRIEGTDKWGDLAYFEANDMDTDAPVIVEAIKPPKEDGGGEKPWQVERVFARTADGVKEMRDFAPATQAEDKPVDDFALRMLTKELSAEAEKHGLAGKITVRAVRQIVLSSGISLESGGVYERGARTIQVRSGTQTGAKGIMRHEIIHAMRDSATWGKSHGLFTEKEWRLLERAALADTEIRDSVLDRYPNLDAEAQLEEMVAELYRLWADGRDEAGALERVLEKIMGFFEAMANLLRGRGYLSAAGIMEQIANGTIGGAGPTPSGPTGGRTQRGVAEMREGGLLPSGARRKFKDLLGSAHWKDPGQFASNVLTDAMAGNNGYNTLALVPGRALFSELGKRLMSAKTYLRRKEEMDSLRNDWHGKADEVAQVWRVARNKDPRANDDLMDLMHRSTLSGVDPSKPDTWKHGLQAAAEREISKHGDRAERWATAVMDQIERHKTSYATLKARYDALPAEFKDLYRKVRAAYDKLGDEFEKAVLENIEAGLKVAMKRAQKAFRKEMERIKDEGLQGEEKAEAIAKAQATLDAVKARGGWGAKAKIAALRKQFESNRLKGPYFPLARFGQFFVTIRNAQGEVTSFSRFEKESQQQAFIREQKDAGETNIQFGVISDSAKLREQVDPAFVADVEGVLADAGASEAVMDAIWQRWLETLPDTSIRTAKIHRKGREGWNKDAFRAFGSHMFHGAHQLARLKYGLELEEALNDAEDEARVAEDPNRAGLIVNEMRRRHEFTMNPQGSSVVAGMSSLAFVWYLGATPAAALANISQTTVMGPGIMAARFQKAGVSGAVREIGRAMAAFTKGRGDVQKAPGITQDEHAAITEAYKRGTIDKTQAHDLASVAETGIEYNATREMVMRKISWFFHHAERMNREVTFLANYRLARDEGMNHADAIDAAADLTWKIHFDYQNTSRPRFMQNDLGKILTIFRNYSVNLAYRIFRDAHQTFRGATKEERAEARTQLVGVTLSMMAHAGVKGTYGYGIAMLLLSMFFPGDSDDLEEWMQDALLMEGDSLGVAAWNYTMGAALNGVPGQILGASLSERIGSPNIWFRGPSSDLEGADLYNHYVGELLGPVYGIGSGFFRGAQLVSDGEIYRGVEAAVPKVVRDLMKAGRYGAEGVETISGDDILPDVNPYQLLLQASGFTPAEVAERFEMNTRLKNKEREIMDERKGIHKAAVDAILAGEEIPESVLEDIRDFNARFPEYPITSKTIRQSAQGRQRAHASMEGGVSLNKRLAERLREGLAPAVYN